MRKKQVAKKPYLTFLVALFFYLLLGVQIYFIDPIEVKNWLIPGAYLSFFMPLSLALFFSFGSVLHRRSSLLFTISLLVYFYLRIYGFGSWLNLLLLLGIFISLELYFHKSAKKD